MNICLILINKYSEFTNTTTTSLATTQRDAHIVVCDEVVKTVKPGILPHVSIIITCISYYVTTYNTTRGIHKLYYTCALVYLLY